MKGNYSNRTNIWEPGKLPILNRARLLTTTSFGGLPLYSTSYRVELTDAKTHYLSNISIEHNLDDGFINYLQTYFWLLRKRITSKR